MNIVTNGLPTVSDNLDSRVSQVGFAGSLYYFDPSNWSTVAEGIERVLLLGAGSPVGQHAVQLLRSCEIEIRAVTCAESNLPSLRDSSADSVVVRNLGDSTETGVACSGCDAVISVLGAKNTLRDMLTRRHVVEGGTSTVVDSAVAEDVDQFVMLSANGVGDSRSNLSLGMRVTRSPLLRAKQRAEQHLRDAALSHTIIRPGRLTDEPPTDDLFIGEGGDTVSGTIPRASAARLLVSALWTPEATNRTFEVVSRDGLRGRISNITRFDWRLPVGDGEQTLPRS